MFARFPTFRRMRRGAMVRSEDSERGWGGGVGSKADSGDSRWRLAWPFLTAIALLLVVVTIYAPGLGAGFFFDDFADVVDNPASDPARFIQALPTSVRPLLKLSYVADSVVHGAWAPGYRAVNLLLHLLVTALVWVLARRAAASQLGNATGAWVATVAAGLWTIHPLAVESVTLVSGRSAPLAAVLMLAALALLTADAPRRPKAHLLWAGTLALLAVLARETAVVLPALLLVWQLTVGPRGDRSAAFARQGIALGAVAFGALLLFAMPRHRELLAFSLQARRPLEALRMNAHAVPAMLALWARPWATSIDPAMPAPAGWFNPLTLLFVAILLVAAVSVVALRRRWPLVALVVGWTLVCLAPTNSVIFRLDPIGPRGLYLASLGPTLALAGILSVGYRLGAAGRGLSVGVTLAMGAMLASLTFEANQRYRHPIALWEHAVRYAPMRARPRVNLAVEYAGAGRLAEAQRQLETALELEPWNQSARCMLAGVRLQGEEFTEAKRGGERWCDASEKC
jgi:protein O-mannosyl-transferase